jgi:hypothetical protein
MQYASLENKDRSSVIDRLNKFEAFIFSVGKSPKKKKKVVAPESSTTSTTAASDDFEPTEKTLLTPKIKKRIKRFAELLSRFRRKVLLKEFDFVKEALELCFKGSLKFKTISKHIMPSDWFCKESDSTYLDMMLLEKVAKYGLGAKAFNSVKMEYKHLTSANKEDGKDDSKNDKATNDGDDVEMEDFEESSTTNDKLSDKILKARFEAIVAYIARHNARGFISSDSFSTVEKNFVGESATSRMARRQQQASLGMFISGVSPAVVKSKGKRKRKGKKKNEGKPKKVRQLKGKAPTEFEEPIQAALLKNQEQISHKVAQEVGALILARTELPYEPTASLKVLSFGQIYEKEGKGALHSKAYIFAIGYKAEKTFKSFKNPRERVTYTQEILLPEDEGAEGDVLYRLTASDAPDEPIESDSSATRVWNIVLNKIKAKCEKLNLPKSKQLISGPKFFGLSNPQVQLRLEGLEGAEKCENYRFFLQKSYSSRLSKQREMEEKSSAIPEKKAEETLPETTSSTTTSNNTEANVEKTNEITVEVDEAKEISTTTTDVVKLARGKKIAEKDDTAIDLTDVPKSLSGPPSQEIPFNSIGNKRVRPIVAGKASFVKKKSKLNTTPNGKAASPSQSKSSSSSGKKRRSLSKKDSAGSAVKKVKKITSFFTKIL